ncbi:hypothetical protein WJX72_001630 [[Myrmecia] bisecta]|uniref:Uncharacterized protein n=1 Tax=[Myrmecia] bisecta TaxID=41462 RepID=A0AAW1PVA5_9CHLO
MEHLSQRLSAAWVAGKVDSETAALVQQEFPTVRLLSIAVEGPTGLLTAFSNFAAPGFLVLSLLHPANSAAGHAIAAECPVRFCIPVSAGALAQVALLAHRLTPLLLRDTRQAIHHVSAYMLPPDRRAGVQL